MSTIPLQPTTAAPARHTGRPRNLRASQQRASALQQRRAVEVETATGESA